jgi:adenosine deaminase
MTAKIDTHRHLGGSIPTTFIWQIIQDFHLTYLAESLLDVERQMTFSDGEQRGFHRFLNKFRILDEITWTEKLIDASVQAICDGLRAENIAYCWLDFSVNKYMHIGWHKKQAIKFIYDAFQQHYPDRVGLVLSLKYESLHANQRQYAALIDDSEIGDYLIGLDLVGDEDQIDCSLHSTILRQWAAAGMMIRAHVGEFGPAQNVRLAIDAGATNIAHGLAIHNQPDLIKIARENGICFDLGIGSNFLTNVTTPATHPMSSMIKSGLTITLGTDDPVICKTTLNNEFQLASDLGATPEDLMKMQQAAISTVSKFIKSDHVLSEINNGKHLSVGK